MRENISLVKEHLLLITEKRIMFAYKTHLFLFLPIPLLLDAWVVS